MKAAVYCGPHDVRVQEVSDPKVGDNGIIIRVRACGICGSDLHYYERGGVKVKPGSIMGHEFSGDVVEVGKAVKNIKVGDRVAAASCLFCQECYWCKSGQYFLCPQIQMGGFDIPGAYAEYTAVPLAILNQTVFQLPDNVSYEAGALMEPLGVGLYAARRAEPVLNDTIVIFGAGTIGLSVLAAFKTMGIFTLIVSEIAEKRCQAAMTLGANIVIDAGLDDVFLRVLKETDGKGADIAVECVGLRKPFLQAMKVLRIDGKLIQVGVFDKAFEFNPVTITTKNLRIIGCLGGDYLASMDMLRLGKIVTGNFITHEFPLANISEAFETQLQADQSIKVMIQP